MSPARSKAQRRLFAIASHEPGILYKHNKDVLKMGKGMLHDFASTSEKGLPSKVKKKSKKKR